MHIKFFQHSVVLFQPHYQISVRKIENVAIGLRSTMKYNIGNFHQSSEKFHELQQLYVKQK